jgi:uncharacterized DUF497 family protein
MMFYEFRWMGWNLEKIGKHGLGSDEVEYVANHARRPFPKPIGNDKWVVIGATVGGKWIEAIYVIDDDGTTLFVIHARPLTQRERHRHHRNRRRK